MIIHFQRKKKTNKLVDSKFCSDSSARGELDILKNFGKSNYFNSIIARVNPFTHENELAQLFL
jgi:hypothetical protein